MQQKMKLGVVIVIIVAVAVVYLLSASAYSGSNTQLTNPASAYCEQQGYRVEIVTAADGSQSGNCVAPGGKACDEWAFYRGECSLS